MRHPVFRVVLSAFGNPYLSLTKTTSLGIAIGFSDLFSVYGTAANERASPEGVTAVCPVRFQAPIGSGSNVV
ncbi:MAG: hypothetical protein ABI887_00130 [Burkholderiales bacterium]